jgi:hypothetical protein
MSEQGLNAIAYPTIKRAQVFTGDSQLGSNCSLSANSGLPALSMPAGFTSHGLPVGLELAPASQSLSLSSVEGRCVLRCALNTARLRIYLNSKLVKGGRESKKLQRLRW